MSTSIGSFTGLGSGFDYQSLVDQMIQIASQPAQAMQTRMNTANAQIGAYKTYDGLLTTLEAAAKQLRDGTAFGGVNAAVSNAIGTGGRTLLSATASTGAAPGSYAVQVLQVAQAEKLSGTTFASGSTALNIAGDFRINGQTITVAATDTLTSIRDRINAANSGSAATGVMASVVTDSSNAQRLVLTSQKSGAAGIDVVDGAQGIAQQLGWIDSTSSIKHVISAGAQSDTFTSSTAPISQLLGLTISNGPQAVTIAGQSVSIDLATDSLTSIAAKLSTMPPVQATVKSTTVNGVTKYYLEITNTTNFVDGGNTLQQLGVLTGGRSAVAQQVQSAALTDSNGTTPATAASAIANLWNGGSAGGAVAGDTLSISGTRGDGSAVNLTYTIGSTSTLQDLLDALNNTTDGFGAGSRPATATIDAGGHIVVSDGSSGQSALSLQIVANNQGGGRFDTGAFSTATAGRARELVAGTDARLSVDGVAFTRSSNTVTDVIDNVTLNLTAADSSTTATVTVNRDASAAQASVQSYVTAYNKVVDFIQQQQTPASDATNNPILYNDGILRQARAALSGAMLASVTGAASDLATAASVGVSLTKDAHLSLDASVFQTAFNTRFTDVERLFMEQGTSTNPSLYYTTSTSATQPGTYAVSVTQAARQALVVGSGFSGVYADDGTPDSMTISDPSGKNTVQVQLTNGMTTAQIVSAMNSAFGTPETRVVQSTSALTDVTGSASATSATRLLDLHLAAGANAGVVAGDTIGYSGLRGDGTAYTGTFTVTSNSTMADVVTQMQGVIGTTANVSFANGILTVQSATPGASQLTMSLTPNNEGGGQLAFGAPAVTAAGHGLLAVIASAVGNDIQLQSAGYGSAAGFTIAYAGGGTDSTSQLNLAAGAAAGLDVQGTIGGYAATGSGQQLVGATGTPVDGLSLNYAGVSTGAIGSLALTLGVGSTVDRLVKTWSDLGGTIDSRNSQLNDSIASQQSRLDSFNVQMAVRKQGLLQEYLAMDTAISKMKAQGTAFLTAFASNSSSSGNSSGSIFG